MKKVVALCLIAMSAFAGERLLGVIQTIDTTKSNLSQNPDGGPNSWDGGYEQPFCIPERARVTVRCAIDTYVCTDKTACTAVDGLPLTASVLLPSSVGAGAGTVTAIGGQKFRCGTISTLSTITDGGYHACQVWERMGNE